MRWLALVPLALVALLAGLWACAALWFDAALPRPLAGALAGGFALAAVVILARVRPWRRAALACVGLFAAVLVWWLSLAPSNQRPWQPDVARPATARIEGDRVTLENVRNFEYRGEHDYTERWEERRYDLATLRGADMFLSYWGSPWIAHTIMSWEFADGEHLAISIETRKEVGEVYSAVLGFFRQYELYYVVADERDVIGVRANQRGEDVYLYRLRASPETARRMLVDYLEEINRLAERPTWYNAFSHNCTTTIRHHFKNVAASNPWNWRILVNGKIDEMGYERGTINTSLPFPELRARSRITDVARTGDSAPDFSTRIRAGLPARPD